MSIDNEQFKNIIYFNNQNNIESYKSENILKNNISDIIPSEHILNLKKIKGDLKNNNHNSNKYSEEKSSERNALEDYSQKSEKNLNLGLNEFNKRSIISDQNTIIENNENEKNNTIHFNKTKKKIVDINNILDIKFTGKNNDKLIIKNKKKNIIGINIKKDLVDNILANKSYSNSIKVYKKEKEKIYKCLFCDKISTNNLYNSLFTCPHFFCMHCGKNFFEELIEISIKLKDSDLTLKCPIIKCQNIIPLPLLKMILSEKYYKYIIENLVKINKEKNKNEKSEEKVKIYNLKTENIITENTTNKKENIKYNTDNIINIINNDNFHSYVGKTFILCSYCKEYTLYGNVEGNYDLCLNCLNKYCKYCHKLYNKRHFEKTYINHCRVVYRAFKDYSKCQKLRRYIYNLLYIIAGYLFLLTFFLVKIKRLSRIKNIFVKIIKGIFFFLLFILFLPAVLLILPYYPIIVSI